MSKESMKLIDPGTFGVGEDGEASPSEADKDRLHLTLEELGALVDEVGRIPVYKITSTINAKPLKQAHNKMRDEWERRVKLNLK